MIPAVGSGTGGIAATEINAARGARPLRLFAQVREGEAARALLLASATFLLLCAYYVLKTVREPLILTEHVGRLSGAELKAYATAAEALLCIAVVPAYGWLASRTPRAALVRITVTALVACLLLFWALGRLGVPLMGVAYYVWLGVAILILVAQFWSVANDLHTREQGERLFPLIATGGALGAIVGARVAVWLSDIGTFELMLVGAGMLGLYLAACAAALRQPAPASANAEAEPEAPLGRAGAFTLVRRTRYLLMIAALMFSTNFVNTQGEYILATTVKAHAEAVAPAQARDAHEARSARRKIIERFYGRFYSGVNTAVFLLQAFVVARVLGRFGVGRALFVVPAIAVGVYVAILALPLLSVVSVGKATENAANYSLHNTVRQALFLPTTREAKYKAKAAIDSFFVRAGDVAAGAAIFAGIHVFRFSLRGFALINLVVTGVWLAIAAGVAGGYVRAVGARAPR